MTVNNNITFITADDQELSCPNRVLKINDVNNNFQLSILREHSREVRLNEIEHFKPFIAMMINTMYQVKGIGLAAVQVGVPLRIAVIDVAYTADQPKKPIVLINPVIKEISESTNFEAEGCLSVPGFFNEIERPFRMTVEYVNLKGEAEVIEGQYLMAACLRHEIDHMDGRCVLDHVSPLRRKLYWSTVKKIRKKAFRDVRRARKSNSLPETMANRS